jgi:ribonuclease D
MTLRVVTDQAELEDAVASLRDRGRLACDLESNGMFAYRAKLCIVQLAVGSDVVVVDTLAAPAEPLGRLLGPEGPVKIVHDVAFDARILAEHGVELGNVHDTSVIARMLGRTATGLASLLGAELGVTIDKKMQHHDWSKRPLETSALAYLAADVLHLELLDEKLWAEATAKGIVAEIEEETRYRLACSIASAREVDPRPPWVRVKGVDKLPAAEQAVLRRLCDVREREAKRLDVPPYKVVANEVLLAIAHARPASRDELSRIRGARQGRAAPLANALLEAVRAGASDGRPPAEERQMLERPRVAPAVARARRERESRLVAWRREEAKRRGVDEQVVLPGHCVQDLVDLEEPTRDALARVPGLGGFRVERDGDALLGALAGQPAGGTTR